MNLYKCVVYDKNKKRKTIEVNLESEESINDYAARNKLKVVNIKSINKNINKEKVKDKELRIICKKMSILLESGCEITKLFHILSKQSNKKIGSIMNKVQNKIQRGNSIEESFLSTNLFSKFFISMVKAGEVSGNLDMVMDHLADYYDKEHKLKSKIITISIYPTILTMVSIVVTIFILVSIIPNFQMIFENNSIKIPIMTKILMRVSAILRENFLYIIMGSSSLVTILIYFIKTNYSLKYKINTLKFKLPIINNLTKLTVTTRFSRALYILLSSGIQIIEAIDISAKVVGSEFAYERITIANEYIKKGNGIGESLGLVDIFPEMFISMINIGEESGKLDTTLNTINKFYESELDTKIGQFMSAIEPIVIVFIGIIVGGLIISMVMPMFDMVNSI